MRLALSRSRDLFRRPQAHAVIGTAIFNAALTAAGTIGGVLLARGLGPASRGELVVVLQWSAASATLSIVGLNQATCYAIARTKARAAEIAGTALVAAGLTGLVVAVGGNLLAPYIGSDERVIAGLRIAFALAPANLVASIWVSSVQAVNIARWNRIRAIQPLAYFAAICALFAVGSLTLSTAIIAFALSMGGQLLMAGATFRRSFGRLGRPRHRIAGELYRYGVRVWLGLIPRAINVQLDVLFLSVAPSVTLAELGNYAVAASLSRLALPLAAAFGSVAFPAVAASSGARQTDRMERLSVLGAIAVTTIVMTPVLVLAPVVVPVLFGVGFEEVVPVLVLLAPGTVFLSLNVVLSDLLQGSGQPLATSVGEGAAVFITILMLTLLVPSLGIRGAAVASSTAYASASAVLLWYSVRSRGLGMPVSPIEASEETDKRA